SDLLFACDFVQVRSLEDQEFLRLYEARGEHVGGLLAEGIEVGINLESATVAGLIAEATDSHFPLECLADGNRSHLLRVGLLLVGGVCGNLLVLRRGGGAAAEERGGGGNCRGYFLLSEPR